MDDKLFEMKKSLREDWTVLPFLTLTLLGFAIAVIDFVFRQNFNLQVFGIAGLCLLLVGGVIRLKARLHLKRKGGFSSLIGTAQLQIVKKHQLVIDGPYRYVRHPLYLGEILRNLGVVVLFSSVYGILIVILASVFLIFRIQIEEKMLIVVFGEEYKEYARNIKKIIPYFY